MSELESPSKLANSTSVVSAGTLQKKQVVDPYKLNFKELRENYMKRNTKKVKFAKSSFLHYCKNNYLYADKYGGEDTVVTMELVQEPMDLKYNELKADDPNKMGTKCDQNDPLVFRQKPRERAPYYGDDRVACSICYKETICYRGYYTCENADKDCDYDVCQECYRGKKAFRSGVTCPSGDPLSLRSWNAEGATCDVCEDDIELEDGFYQCYKNCNYCICSKCFTGEKAVCEGKTCSQGDVVKRRTEPRQRDPYNGGDAVSCNICGTNVMCEDGYYCCGKADEDCNDDYCRDCYIEAKGPPTCDQGHILEPVDDTNRSPGCDVCGDSIDVSEEYFRCEKRCNYDVCPKCIEKREYLIMEELGEHDDSVATTKGGPAFGICKKEQIEDDSLPELVKKLNNYAEDMASENALIVIDLGFNVQASNFGGSEKKAVGWILYKEDLSGSQVERSLKCVIKTHTDKSWDEVFNWFKDEVRKAGNRYFKHCYSKVGSDSNEIVTAVWYWDHIEKKDSGINFEHQQGYDWDELQEAAKNFAGKCYQAKKIIDVKMCVDFTEDEYFVSFVTVDDPNSQGGFIFGFEQTTGSHDVVLRELCDKVKSLSTTLYVGATICNYDDNEDEEKVMMTALFDPTGESIAPAKASGDRTYTGDMFTSDKKRKPLTYQSSQRQCQGEKRTKTDTVDHVVISNWRVGGMHLHYARLNNVTIPHPPVTEDDRFYFSHFGDAIYWLVKIDASTTGIVVLYLSTFKWYLHPLNKVPPPKNLASSSLICKNNVLVFNNLEAKKGKRLSGDFLFYDLFSQEVIWRAQEVERCFFTGIRLDQGEKPEENDKELSGLQCGWQNEDKQLKPTENQQQKFTDKNPDDYQMPARMIVLRLTVREKEADQSAQAKTSKENEIVYTFHEVNFEDFEFKEKDEALWQHTETSTLAVYPPKEEEKKDDSVTPKGVIVDINAALAAGMAGKANQKAAPQQPLVETPKVLFSYDYTLTELVMIFSGQDGDEHRIFQFANNDDKKKLYAKTSTKAGNTRLAFSQNCFLKSKWATFLIVTLPSGRVEAAPIDAIEERVKYRDPPIEMENADGDYEQDVWFHYKGGRSIQSLAKSKVDDFLNASCIDTTKWDSGDVVKPEDIKKVMRQHNAKIKSQDIQITYPVIASNTGCNRISIQSISKPDDHYSFTLADEEEFLCFSSFEEPQNIGLKDNRNENQKAQTQFEETGTYVAFLTRAMYRCEKKKDCNQGDIMINLLKVDPYAEPMTFTLFQTKYEACMSEGSRDDQMHKSFVFEVQSTRGCTDMALCNQYNDSIVFDCITSTKQTPIRFPLKLKTKNNDEDKPKNDNDDEDENGDKANEDEFEQLEICKGVKPVPVPMLMDKFGSIHFLISDSKGTVRVYRVNREAVMGQTDFFEVVYSFQSKWVYFFQYDPNFNRFYIMDDTKRIRVLGQDQQTKTFYLQTTLDLCKNDKDDFDRTPFDEFTVSPGMIHYNEKTYTMIENKNRDNYTWQSLETLLPSYDYLSGPSNIKNSGMIFYVQQFKDTEEIMMLAPEVKARQSKSKLSGLWANAKAPEPQKNPNFFGKHCIVVQPMADLSFIDCLPQCDIHRPNAGLAGFFSFISPEHIMAHYNEEYLVFSKHGDFCGKVEFEKPEDLVLTGLKLRQFCETKKFFVFEGPPLKKESEDDKKDDKKEQKGRRGERKIQKDGKETAYFVFELIISNSANEKWSADMNTAPVGFNKFMMELREMNVKPRQNEGLKERTTIAISPSGLFDQVTITKQQNVVRKTEDDESDIIIEVAITSATSQIVGSLDATKEIEKAVQPNQVKPEGNDEEEGIIQLPPGVSRKKFTFTFKRDNYEAQDQQLKMQIAPMLAIKADKKSKLTEEQEQQLARLQKREKEMLLCWKLGEHVIAKCGSELKFVNLETSDQQQSFNLTLGPSVWVQACYLTGVEGILQLFLIDDEKMRIFIITWNMEVNREHSMYQTRFKPGVFPENLILQSFGSANHKNYNFILEDGAIVNLSANMPCQFFDKENEVDLVPRGNLKQTIGGQKKMSECRQVYLDCKRNGHLHHFISLMDLVYWERFEIDRAAHELGKGKVTSFSPVSRFPNQLSVFHHYATDLVVLSAFSNAFQNERNSKKDDKRVQMFPLLFMSRHPQRNKFGQRPTPLQVTLEKQSPQCFEIMISMLNDQTGLCLTGHLLGKIKEIIDNPSPAVLQLFDECFRVTDQIDGPRPLKWGGDAEELFVEVPTSYLEEIDLQNLVDKEFKDNEKKEDEEEDQFVTSNKSVYVDGFVKYDVSVDENIVPTQDEQQASQIKQVEAKLLDMDWVFTENNAKTLIQILAETSNDAIFATAQIRVFIEFMWKFYFDAICYQLFLPYVVYMLSFTMYASFMANTPWNEMSFISNILKVLCLIVFFPLWAKFLNLELQQVRGDPVAYASNFWNILDMVSLVSCGTFMGLDLLTSTNTEVLNVISALAVLILWMKLFYWLRLFKAFSAFIRMISEIVMDIRVFAVMLFIVFVAFGNCIIILNKNRDPEESLFADYLGIAAFDALINAYLIGLGDFGYDTYSSKNKYFVWIFFLGATFIVQLVFMNMLIAMMGESFGRISGLLEQATLKELCVMMNDNEFLIDIGQKFKTSRYILWLTPGVTKPAGSVVERQIQQLRDYVEDRQEVSDNSMLRQMGSLDEQLKEIKANLDAQANPETKDEDRDEVDDDASDDSHDGMENRLDAMDNKLEELTKMVKDLVKNSKGNGNKGKKGKKGNDTDTKKEESDAEEAGSDF